MSLNCTYVSVGTIIDRNINIINILLDRTRTLLLITYDSHLKSFKELK